MNRGTALILGDTGRPEHRVVRVLNLHFEARGVDIHNFFGNDFTVVDFIRGINPKTNKNTVGYVLFATEQERINSQTLSGRKLLDREVKIVPAVSGFSISSSGDKLLSPAKGNIPVTDMNEVVEASPPAVGNPVAFPSLDAPATPARRAAISATPKLILAQTREDLLHDRVLFMNNVGQGLQVNETSFRLYFGKYTVIDVKRPLDLQRNVPHPTAFVMLGSVEQRDQAVKQLKDVPMQGRQVTLEVPKAFQNVDEHGFLTSSNENAITLSADRRATVVNNTLHAAAVPHELIPKGLQPTPIDVSETSQQVPSTDTKCAFLLGQLEMAESEVKQQEPPKLRQEEVEVLRRAVEKRQARKMMEIWGVSHKELCKRYVDQQRNLLPMPSGLGVQSQIITSPPMTLPVDHSSPFGRILGSRYRGSPPDIDTSFCPREYQWNLTGDQDPAHNLIAEEAWYCFQFHHQVEAQQQQHGRDSSTHCIMTGGGEDNRGKIKSKG